MSSLFIGLSVWGGITATPSAVRAQTYTLTTVSSFNGSNGTNPYAGLTTDSNGNLYGRTASGGSNSNGTVFEMAAGSNNITTVASFDSTAGPLPSAGLTIDSRGDIYGTTDQGGSGQGIAFEIAAGSKTIATIATFTNSSGILPATGLIFDNAGNLYGTAEEGGAYGYGTVYEIAAGTNTLSAIASFNNTNGSFPFGDLIRDSKGDFFGTTINGGNLSLNSGYGYGTVFEIAAGSNTITTLFNFNGTNGANPEAGLTLDSQGNLFGTTINGGSSNDGTIFEIAAGSNVFTTLASFNGTNGTHPEFDLTRDSNGNLYGTTNSGGAANDGTIFEFSSATNTLVTLTSFNGVNGANPESGLTRDSNGDFFGTTYSGGASNDGTLFELKINGVGSSTAPESGSLALLLSAFAPMFARKVLFRRQIT